MLRAKINISKAGGPEQILAGHPKMLRNVKKKA